MDREAYQGKTVIVTGASSGLGLAVAKEFARRGARVILTGRRMDRLEGAADALRRQGYRASAQFCDVRQDGSFEQALAQARSETGRIDVVVANAGVSASGQLSALKLEDYRQAFETNVFGALRALYAAVEDLKRSQGSFVLIGSISGKIPFPDSSAYCMTKFSLAALAESVRPELEACGIRLVHVLPGVLDTEMHREGDTSAPPRWIRVAPERAARAIVSGVARGRREIVVSAHGKILLWLNRFFPRLLSGLLSSRRGTP